MGNWGKNITLTYNYETLSIRDWSKRTSIPISIIYNRKQAKWTPERIFETPIRYKKDTPINFGTTKNKVFIDTEHGNQGDIIS